MIKPEQISDKMDQMVDELKNKIHHNHPTESEIKKSNHHQQESSYQNDYFIGKRMTGNTDEIYSNKAHQQKVKRIKIEEPAPVVHKTQPIPMQEEPKSPRPALNISLIDSTYQFKQVIDGMWEGVPTARDPYKGHLSGDERDHFEEFELNEEFN